MDETVTIDRIGHRGDGIADTPDGPVYVPLTLPGEVVRVAREGSRGRLLDVVAPSPMRVTAPCAHSGTCGGCALQMMPLEATRALKRRFVIDALAQHGIEASVDETIGVPPASRRRAVLTATRAGKRILLGFHERLSNRLVDVESCGVLVPEIAGKLPALRRLAGLLVGPRGPARMTVLATRTGLDVTLRDCPPPPPRALPELAALCSEARIARLTVANETVLTLAEPVIEVAGVPLVPPPGGFAQASREAEAAMTALVLEHLAGARSAADLFCGFGTFALALARHAPVRAVESEAAALAALDAAARRASGLKPIRTERRDLFRHPLSDAELAAFDVVVLDPPAGGARAQAEALSRAPIRRIAFVSCNPATLARDARVLIDGGYELARVVPVDQFVWSAEVEAVGLFVRR